MRCVLWVIVFDTCLTLQIPYRKQFAFGGNGEKETPVPIPNTEVKLFSADGTAPVTEWESRTPPRQNFEPFL